MATEQEAVLQVLTLIDSNYIYIYIYRGSFCAFSVSQTASLVAVDQTDPPERQVTAANY